MFNKVKGWVYGVFDQARLSIKTSRSRWVKGIVATAAVAVIGTTGTIGYQQHMDKHTNEIFHIYVADERVGSVSSPGLVRAYIEDKQKQLEQAYPDVLLELETDDVTYQSEKGYKLESDDTATLEQLDGLLAYHARGVELKVDGELIGIVKDEATAKQILGQIEAKYVTAATPYVQSEQPGEVSILSLEANRGFEAAEAAEAEQVSIEEVSFLEEIEMKEIETIPDEIEVDIHELVRKLENTEEKRTTYVVEQGDCLSCIASKLNIDEEVILENNPSIQEGYLQIGDELDVTVEEPLLSVKTVESYQKQMPMKYSTEYIEDAELRKGQSEKVQDGQNGLKQVTYQQTKVNGKLKDKEIVQVDVLKEPIPEVIKKGTKVIPGEGTGTFRWPVSGAKVSSHYGPRWGTIHKGIDLTSKNRNIYAADHGKVIKVEYDKGYGNYIVINHNNGFKTLYAHLSKTSISNGDTVEKGQIIGTMGSTGHSTGVHLHFEIHKHDVVKNPADYLN